ncbi:hypothetical protein BSKO_03794 [Bryopsis sp. KO-2023]|nr:hypothetical protein BSKO_03794 [Bryopsis sp. KO-2023]
MTDPQREIETTVSTSVREKIWDAVDNAIWTAIGSFLMYYGDGKRSLPNLLLQKDERINGLFLWTGFVCFLLNACIFLYFHFWCGCWMGRRDVTPELVAPLVLKCGTAAMMISIASFMAALWGVFGWLAVPMIPLLGIFFTTILEWVPFIRGKCEPQSNQAKTD